MAWPPGADGPLAGVLPRCTFPVAGVEVVCAVSGGADSLALLALAAAAGCAVTAVHIDHGLRVGSAEEARVVEKAAAEVGAAFRSVAVDVGQGPNLEARARAARRAALGPGVLTGHTADDQAETVLLNLLRGAGLDGLAGMRAGPTKPLLAVRRHETRAVCAELGWAPVVDLSNTDPSFRRNRVRHELLPLLDAIADRDVAAVIAGQAGRLRDEADLLDGLAAAIDATDAKALAAAPAALARRAVRRWLVNAAGLEHPPPADAVERVLAVARGEAVACEGPGWSVRRSGMRLSCRGHE